MRLGGAVLEDQKRCTKCGTIKPLSEYHKRSDGKQSHRSQCKPCQHETNKSTRDITKRRESDRRQRAANPERFRDTQARYRDRHRDALRQLWKERYHASPEARLAAERKRQRSHPDYKKLYMQRWRKENAERRAEYAKQYYHSRLEYYREKNARWHRLNVERAREINRRHRWKRRNSPGSHTKDQLLSRWAYYGGRCWLCGAVADTTDHVIPLSGGGTNWPANLRPACRSCNSGKRDRDWRRYAYGAATPPRPSYP